MNRLSEFSKLNTPVFIQARNLLQSPTTEQIRTFIGKFWRTKQQQEMDFVEENNGQNNWI